MEDYKFEENWVEHFFLLFLILGFIISVLLKNDLLSYISILFAGGLFGRIYYIKRYKEPILPFILLILGFLIGYLIGSFWTNRFLILLFFSTGFFVSYYLHLKKILVIFKSKRFVK
jgi:hypothetical protein